MGGHTAHRLDGQRQRGHIHEQQAFSRAGQHLAAQPPRLHGSAQRHTFVGVQALARLQVHHPQHLGLHGGDAGGAAHQQHLIQIVGGQPCVLQGVSHRQRSALDEIGGQLLKSGAGQRGLQMHRAAGPVGDKRQVDVRLRGGGKLLLDLLRLLPQPLHGNAVGAQINAVLVGKALHQPVHNAGVKVIAAQMVVSAGGQHLHDAVPDLDQRHIKGPTAQIVHHHGLGLAVVQPVGQRGGSRLIDDALDIQPGNASGVLGGLPLGVVEVGGHRDDRLMDLLSQIRLRVRLELLQNERTDLLRSVAFAVDGKTGIAAHQPFDAAHRAGRVCHGLPFGRFPHQPFPVFGERHNAGGGALALGIGDHNGLAALDDCHTAVGGPQINANDLRHNCKVLSVTSSYPYFSAQRGRSCCEFVNNVRPLSCISAQGVV